MTNIQKEAEAFIANAVGRSGTFTSGPSTFVAWLVAFGTRQREAGRLEGLRQANMLIIPGDFTEGSSEWCALKTVEALIEANIVEGGKK